MESFKHYIQTPTVEERLLAFSFVLENYNNNSLNESPEYLEEGVHDLMKKFGIHAEKGDGLISYISKFTKGAGKLILAAIKGDKEKVKEIASGLKKEEVLDFLLKLDTATMHLVTGPLHTIDAITGWHLWANIEHAAKKGKSVLDQVKAAYQKLKTAAAQAFKKAPEKLKAVADLEPLITYENS